MIHVGIDYHKRYSQVCVMNDQGEISWEGEIQNTREALLGVRRVFPEGEPVQSVLEAGREWGKMFDLLEELDLKPKLANPLKVRLIADSFIKTDKVDARALTMLLKADMLPLVHVPPKEVREQKNLLRHRKWLVQEQTRVKNRIHNILDRNHVPTPPIKNIFGKEGASWLRKVELPEIDANVLKSHLDLLEEIKPRIRETEKWIKTTLKAHPYMPILQSFPGIGEFLSALITLEINNIDRFSNPGKLLSYSGLVASIYSSGGKSYRGHLLPTCNHHLRFAYIEAAWIGVRDSPYFSAYFRRLCSHLGKQDAIIQVARKLCILTYHCLKEKRAYEERPYRFQLGRLHRRLAS